jgi:DNA mismatch repair ATPase MutL
LNVWKVYYKTATGSINKLYKEIISLVDEYSIICFDVRFCLKNGSKTEIMKHALKGLRDSICARRGKKVLSSLQEETIVDSTKNISIHAFVPNDPESM